MIVAPQGRVILYTLGGLLGLLTIFSLGVQYGRKMERIETAQTEPYWSPEAALPVPEAAPPLAAAPNPPEVAPVQQLQEEEPPTVVITADPPKPAEGVKAKSHEDGGSRFSIQVAAVRDRSEAERLVSSLQKQGFDAYMGPTHFGSKGRWYRVWVGKFGHKEDAAKLSKTVAHKAKRSTFVVSMK